MPGAFSCSDRAFLQSDGLPFNEILSESDIADASLAEVIVSPKARTTVILRQSLSGLFCPRGASAQRLRSCAAAVLRVTVLCVAMGREPPSPDTGAYCRTRTKLPERVLTRLVYEVADNLESQVPAGWLWLGRHVKVGDGTTLMAPDTERTERSGPSRTRRSPAWASRSCARVVLFSLATAAACGVAVGPNKGKGTGEPALLRELFDRFQAGNVFLGDCYFCSYFLLTLLAVRHVDVVGGGCHLPFRPKTEEICFRGSDSGLVRHLSGK